MEIASYASAWLVVITTTFQRVIHSLTHNIAQKRNLGVWKGWEEGGATVLLDYYLQQIAGYFAL